MYIRIYPCIYTYIYIYALCRRHRLHIAPCTIPLHLTSAGPKVCRVPHGISQCRHCSTDTVWGDPQLHDCVWKWSMYRGVSWCIVVYRGVYPKFVILTGMMITMITYYMFGHPIKQIQTALAGGQASRQKKIGQAFKILRLCSSVWFFLSLFLSDSLRGQIYSYGIPTWRRGHQRRRHPSLSAGSSVAVSESRLGPWVPGSRTLAPNLIYQRGNSLQVTTDHIKCVYYLCIQCPYLRI